MADNGTYSIRLKLIDEATGKLAQFNKALRQAQAPVEKFNAQARMFGKLTGISSAINQLKGLSDTAMKAGLAVAGIGGVATIAGLANMAKEFAATGMQLTNMSKSLDIAAGKLYQFQGASKLAGLSSDAMASSVQSIQNAVNDAKWGRNIPALTAFRMSGVDIGKDDPDTIMRKASLMLEKHQKDWSAATKRNYLNVMGIGENMLPALAGGPQAYDARNAKSKALLGDTEGAAQAGRRLADALNEASLAGQGLGNSLMTTLEPVLTPLVGSVRDLILQWRDWITQNKSLIQSKVTEYLALFKQYLPEIIGGIKALIALRAGLAFVNIATGAMRMTSGFMAMGRFLLTMNPTVLAAVGAITSLAFAYDQLTTAYRDYQERTDMEKSVQDAKEDIRKRYLAMPPDKRAAWDALHLKNSGTTVLGDVPGSKLPTDQPVQSGTSDFDTQKRLMLPHAIGSAYKNNNPTNLAYFPGQPFVKGKNGRWGTYNSPAEGLAAGLHQMLLDQDRGTNTITAELNRRSPASDNNNTNLMIARIAKESGLDPNKPYNLRDPDTAKKFLSAVVHGGESNAIPSQTDLDKAVTLAYSVDPMNKYLNKDISGKIDVGVNVSGNHPATATVNTSGSNLNKGKMVMAQAMPLAGSP